MNFARRAKEMASPDHSSSDLDPGSGPDVKVLASKSRS